MKRSGRTAGRLAALAVFAAGVAVCAAAAGADAPAPKLLKSVQPDYPVAALKDEVEGWVDVEFTVAVDGTVHDVSVVQSEPEGTFEIAAVKAVARWTFTPASRGGKPIESQVRVRVDFKP